MRLDDITSSTHVEDRRGLGGRAGRAGGLGLGGMIVVGLLGWALGVDPRVLMGGAEMLTRGSAPMERSVGAPPADEMGLFAGRILRSTEEVWERILPEQAGQLVPRARGLAYNTTKLVLFSGSVRSACGGANAAMGPFYCPADRRVYIDLTFFRDMERTMRVKGDFAWAYVIAHEVAHHVQTELGILPAVQERQRQVSRREANALLVRLELQADCLAGVWAHHAAARIRLDRDDIREGMNAAAAVGDDRLQKQSQGYVVPDSFTHGTSEQRQRWLMRGLQSGQMSACDTFRVRDL